jgi:hypothetical protein
MAERAHDKGPDRAIARLLRFLGNAGCDIISGEGPCRLSRPDAGTMTVEQPALSSASRQGLVLIRDTKVFATTEARNWLRRQIADRDDAFLDQHRTIETAAIKIDGVASSVRINTAESPLALLSRLRDKAGQPWFPPDAILAGERLARDFHFGALQPRLTQSFEPRTGQGARPGPGAAAELNDSTLAARRRVAIAIEAMGPDLSGVALDICCFEKGLETVERERLWPARSAKLMLRTALIHLHRHYDPPRAAPPRRKHAWGGEGYRPEI